MKNLMHKKQSRWYHRNDGIKLNTLKPETHATVAIIWLVTLILVAVTWHVEQVDKRELVKTAYATEEVASKSAEPKPTLAPIKVEEIIKEEPTQEEIEKYIRTIFGKEARVAIAISHNECNPANAKYPRCILHSDVEYSVGIFQINLYNAKQWIHAGRIPGKTMEEKAEWLKNPFNNTLYAYWVYQKSGWNPWSAYTNGNYLRSL